MKRTPCVVATIGFTGKFVALFKSWNRDGASQQNKFMHLFLSLKRRNDISGLSVGGVTMITARLNSTRAHKQDRSNLTT
jgi:hypothetical protein